MKCTVKQLFKTKENEIWSVDPKSSVYDALKIMSEKSIGALLVINKEKYLVGIMTERDYARKGILEGKSSRETPVGDLMTRPVLFVNPDTNMEECLALMTEKHIRHLPVFEDDQLLGIVSMGDVIKKIITDQQIVIEELEKYISGQDYIA